jgi:hypothetical protein
MTPSPAATEFNEPETIQLVGIVRAQGKSVKRKRNETKEKQKAALWLAKRGPLEPEKWGRKGKYTKEKRARPLWEGWPACRIGN